MLDAWILSMPMPVIKNLYMTSERKIAVAGVFLLGALYTFQPDRDFEKVHMQAAASFHWVSGCTIHRTYLVDSPCE